MYISSVFSVHPNIVRFEERIRHLSDAEITGFFSEDGILLLTLHGSCHPREGCFTVIPDDAEETITGQIMTHNHPSGASFTSKDLREASFFSLKEIRVVGRTEVFSLQPGHEGWPWPQEIVEKFNEIWKRPSLEVSVERIMNRRRADAVIPSETTETMESIRLRIRSDLCCEELARELHLRYRKGRWQS